MQQLEIILIKIKQRKILAGLGKRVFYLHSVHEDDPIIFSTRWVMSYLAGPLTKEQMINLPKTVITQDNYSVYQSETSLNKAIITIINSKY